MAYFRWYGIDNTGKVKTDRMFARSRQEVAQWLSQQHLQELDIIIEKQWFKRAVSIEKQAAFFHHLALLLSAGIRLSDALSIVNLPIKHNYFKLIIADCMYAVQQGLPLHHIIAAHKDVFAPLSGPLIAAGEETGKLALACEQLATYLQLRDSFVKRIRYALSLPALTGIFFVLIVCIFFIFIVPRFEQFFQGMTHPLPLFTQWIFSFSHLMRSWNGISLLLLIGSSMYMIYRLARKKTLALPFICSIQKDYYYALFLKTVAVLLDSGIRLVAAIRIAAATINNRRVQQAAYMLADAVDAGYSLQHACQQNHFFATPELEALIAIGETSGTLARLIHEAGNIYLERAQHAMQRITTFIQPALITVLGLAIGLLIFALYQPILTLSHMIT